MKEAAQRDKRVLQKVCTASMQDRCSFQYRFFHRRYITAVANLPIAEPCPVRKEGAKIMLLVLSSVKVETS